MFETKDVVALRRRRFPLSFDRLRVTRERDAAGGAEGACDTEFSAKREVGIAGERGE